MTTLTPEKEAEEAVRRYVQMRAEKPLRGVDDSIHGLHKGTEWEAELKLADLRNVLSLLSTERQAREAAEKERDKLALELADVRDQVAYFALVTPTDNLQADVRDTFQALASTLQKFLAAKEAAEKEVERLTRERDIALELHQDALRLAGTDVTEAYQIGRGLRPSPFESGWLIEGWDSRRNAFKAEWWSLDMPGTEDGHGWTKDSNLALRFGRERDAQDYINDIGWTEAKPTEHGWGKPVSALPPPVPTEEAEAKPCRHFWNTEAEPVKCALCNITRPTQAPQDVAGLVEEYLGEVTHWIGFSASAINCGEQWTPISEDRYQKVKQARDGLRKLFRPSPISHEDRPLELAAADNNHKALVDGWQEVETAPRISREPFLAWDGDCQFAAYWNSGEWYGYGLVGVVNFTHWRPLPAPPQQAASAAATNKASDQSRQEGKQP